MPTPRPDRGGEETVERQNLEVRAVMSAGGRMMRSMTKKKAESILTQFVGWGLGVGLLGGIIMGLTWPSADTGAFGAEETGSAIGFLIGSLIAWAGNALLFVGMVGWGVKYGREASPIEQSTG
jgi:hypothetical protein